jgi:hypothetical protein
MTLGRRALVIVIATLASSALAAAQGTKWYILDGQHDRCVNAFEYAIATKLPVSSPQSMIDEIRSEGDTPTVGVTRDDAGKVVEAHVTDGSGLVLVWYATEALCLKGKAAGEAAGILARPDELR